MNMISGMMRRLSERIVLWRSLSVSRHGGDGAVSHQPLPASAWKREPVDRVPVHRNASFVIRAMAASIILALCLFSHAGLAEAQDNIPHTIRYQIETGVNPVPKFSNHCVREQYKLVLKMGMRGKCERLSREASKLQKKIMKFVNGKLNPKFDEWKGYREETAKHAMAFALTGKELDEFPEIKHRQKIQERLRKQWDGLYRKYLELQKEYEAKRQAADECWKDAQQQARDNCRTVERKTPKDIVPLGKRPDLSKGHKLKFKVTRGKDEKQPDTGGKVKTGQAPKDIVPLDKRPNLSKGHMLKFKVTRGKDEKQPDTGGKVKTGQAPKDIVPLGKRPDLSKGHMLRFKVTRGKVTKDVTVGGGQKDITVAGGTVPKDITIGKDGLLALNDGQTIKATASRGIDEEVNLGGEGGLLALNDGRTIKASASRGIDEEVKFFGGGQKDITVSGAKGPKDITIGEGGWLALQDGRTVKATANRGIDEGVNLGGKVVIGGGSEHKQKSEQSVSTLPGRKQANGCDFSKPKIVGMGKSGLEGLPKDFPLPPGIKKPWKYEVARGSLYAIGISADWKDTVSFVRKALPAHGWHIIKETKEHEPNSNTDWVHLFFSNSDYCGWVSIGTTVSHAPTPTSMNIGMKKRNGGAQDITVSGAKGPKDITISGETITKGKDVIIDLSGVGKLLDKLIPSPQPPADHPINVGSKMKVGTGIGKLAGGIAKGLVGGLLGGGGRGGGDDFFDSEEGPDTSRDPIKKKAKAKFADADTGTKIRVGAKATKDGLLFSTHIDKAPGKGTFQTVFLEDNDGRRMLPVKYYVYKIWVKITLTVSWTRSTYVDGQLVKRETGGWSESWTKDLGTFVHRELGEMPVEGQPIWRRMGYGRATQGVRGLGTEFPITVDQLKETGPVSFVVHITRPKQDPVTTVPFIIQASVNADGDIELTQIEQTPATARCQ